MMLTVTLQDLLPLLARAPLPNEEPRLTSRLAALVMRLNNRYGDQINDDHRLLLLGYLGEAFDEYLSPRKPGVVSESAGIFRVQYDGGGNATVDFAAGGLAALDDLFGLGGARSVRTPAPDAIRFANPMQPQPSPMYDRRGQRVEPW